MIPGVFFSQSLVFFNLLTSSCNSGTKGRIPSTRTVPTAAGGSWSLSRAQPAAGTAGQCVPCGSVSCGGCRAHRVHGFELAGPFCAICPGDSIPGLQGLLLLVWESLVLLLLVPPRSCQHLSQELQVPAASPGDSPSLGKPPAHPSRPLCWELCQHQGCFLSSSMPVKNG